MELLRRMWADDAAQDASEYALLLVLITVALVTAVTALSGQISAVFNRVTTALGG